MFKRNRCLLPAFLSALLALAPFSIDGRAQGPKTSNQRVAAALELWRGDDPKARLQALQRLKRLGPRAAPAVPELIVGLSDPDPGIRRETAAALGAIGPAARPAVPALISALNDLDREARTAAAWALKAAKPDPRAVMPALVAHLRAGADRRCSVVVYLLADLGEPAVPVLIHLLKDSDKAVWWKAGYSLSEMGPAVRSSIPALIEALRLPDREAREFVATALAGAGPEAVGPLSRALRDRDPKVRGGAARALELLGPRAEAAVPALIAALADPRPFDDPEPPRGPGIDGWGRAGEPRPSGHYAALRAVGPAAVPALLEQLNAPERQARIVALRALGFLGDDAKSSIPRLVPLLKDPDLRDEAVWALGGIGARAALPALVAGLKDPDPRFRARAAEALGRVGWEQQGVLFSSRTTARGAIRPLAAALKDPDPGVRAVVARALSDIGSEASVAAPELVAALEDPVAGVRLAALEAFGRVGRVPAGSLGVLLALLKDPGPRVREAAARAIDEDALKTGAAVAGLLALLKDPAADVRAAAARKLDCAHVEWFSGQGRGFDESPGLVQDPAAPAMLRAALGDPDPRVRAAVAWLLPIFKDEAKTAVPLLAARLKDPDVNVRRAAGEALSRFGPAAKDAAPALLEALADPDENYSDDENVSAKAAKALAAIGPAAKAAMIERLTARLGDADEHVRRRASWALQMLGDKVASPLLRLLAAPKTPRPIKVEVLGVLVEAHDWPGSITSFGEKERPGPDARGAVLALRELARDEDETIRAHARKLLVAVEPSSEAAARALLEAIRAGDVSDEGYDDLLDALGPSAAVVLIEGLKNLDEEVRTASAYGLAGLDEDLPQPDHRIDGEPDPTEAEGRARGLRLRSRASDALVAALKDPDTEVRWAAAWGLNALGTGKRAVAALIEMARDRTTRVDAGASIRLASVIGGSNGNSCKRSADGELLRVAAIQALGGFGRAAAPAVPALADALKDGDGLTCWFAAGVLGEIGPKAKAAVPELIPLLQSKDEVPSAPGSIGFGGMATKPDRLAIVVARALGQIGPDARAAVGPLAGILNAPDLALRAAAAEALGGIGPDAASAVPDLARLLNGPDDWIADAGAEALGRIGAPAVNTLIEALRGRGPETSRRAITALGGIGPAAAPAVPDLVQALADPDEETRVVAAKALGSIARGHTAAAVVPGLLTALKDPDRLVREAATEALGKAGPRDDRTIPVLVQTMRDSDRDLRYAAAEALTEIGMPAFPALRALLRDDDEDLRDDAARALARMSNPNLVREEGETAERARGRTKIPRAALLAALKDPDERIRAGASRALVYVGKDVVPDLIAVLSGPFPVARLQAARTLGFIGGAARLALGPLLERLKDTDPDVRQAAGEAINAMLELGP